MKGMSAAQAGKRRKVGYLRSPLAEYQVYLMGSKEYNWYKIGISSNANERIRDFQFPFELELIAVLPMSEPLGTARRLEKQMHAHYGSKRIRNEWFSDINPEDFLAIGDIIAKK